MRGTAFKEIEREYGGSIVLLFTKYDLVFGNDRITQASMGTGFFVSSSGHIVTNKHVVQPWKFSGDNIKLIDLGYAVDKDSILLSAWPAGVEFREQTGELLLKNAYATSEKKLAIEKTTPDTFIERVGLLESGGRYKGLFHTMDEGDLAILKAKVTAPVKALPLASSGREVEKLDPVMVLGFPFGLNILENKVAETSPSLGEVRKIQKSIMVTAPIVPGNSGGPLLDIHARVVGVSSKTYGDSTLGSCIPIEHVLSLLPETPVLLKEIEKNEAAGEYRAALDDLHLAELRCGSEADQKKIEAVRGRILGVRDGMFEKVRDISETAEKKKACQEIVSRFGRRWAKEAADWMRDL
jgi:S1-C subfamily serine protease